MLRLCSTSSDLHTPTGHSGSTTTLRGIGIELRRTCARLFPVVVRTQVAEDRRGVGTAGARDALELACVAARHSLLHRDVEGRVALPTKVRIGDHHLDP